MLSRVKVSSLAAVASLAILAGVIVAPTKATAQAGIDPAKVEKKQDGQNSRQGESRGDKRRETGSNRESGSNRAVKSGREGRSGGDASSDRSRSTVSTRSDVRRGNDSDRRRVTVRRDRDRDRDRWRGRSSSTVAFVVLGPRVVYRSYGSGWCRALHSGRHWAPRIGWHRGRHVGAVRCG